MKILWIAVAVCAVLAVLAAWLWTPDQKLATLESKYLDSPDDMMEVAGTRLHVRVSGPANAPAVILLHGFGASLHTWEPWSRLLQGAYRVIRFDLPGFGLSPPDTSQDYTDARSIQLLLALMDKLCVRRASLVGNSMGGRIAWTFAAHEPDRVDQLVLISPDGFASPGFQYGRRAHVSFAVKLMRYVLPKPVLRMSLAPAYANPEFLNEELTTRYHDLMLAPGAREAMIQRMQQLILVDPRPWLRRIRAPTLLIWGEQDAMIPIVNATDYLTSIPDITLVRLPGLGHLPHEEDPERALAPVLEFLARRDATVMQDIPR